MTTKNTTIIPPNPEGGDGPVGPIDASSQGTGSAGADGFDLNRLRLSQDFAEQIGVKKALLTVPVRKPNRQEFIRVRPEEAYRIDTAVLDVKEDRETYLVDPGLRADLPGESVAKTLFTVMNRQGVVFLWGVRLPGNDGRLDQWNRSAFQAAELAMQHWVSVRADMSLGAYEVFQASGTLTDPEWPAVDLRTLLHTAFKDRFIRSLDHPILRRLRGEM